MIYWLCRWYAFNWKAFLLQFKFACQVTHPPVGKPRDLHHVFCCLVSSSSVGLLDNRFHHYISGSKVLPQLHCRQTQLHNWKKIIPICSHAFIIATTCVWLNTRIKWFGSVQVRQWHVDMTAVSYHTGILNNFILFDIMRIVLWRLLSGISSVKMFIFCIYLPSGWQAQRFFHIFFTYRFCISCIYIYNIYIIHVYIYIIIPCIYTWNNYIYTHELYIHIYIYME